MSTNETAAGTEPATQQPPAAEDGYWAPASALVVAAHPDDIEFGCGGTIARWTSEGARVTFALLTNGASGSSDPAMTRERLAELRADEQRAAAGVLGVTDVRFLGHEDGFLEPTLEVREQVVRLIRDVRPEVVVTTDPTTRYWSGRINHPDHRAAGEATLAAVIPGSDTRLAYPGMVDEGLEPVKLAGVWIMSSLEPDLVVDVSAFMDTKIEALRRHVTQVGDPMSEDTIGFVRKRSEGLAADHPFQYGEAFRLVRYDRPRR